MQDIATLPESTISEVPPHVLRRLTARDLAVVDLLHRHKVLTTREITAALFTSSRKAQRRLAILHHLGVVSREPATGQGSSGAQYLYAIASLGHRLRSHEVASTHGRTVLREGAAGRLWPSVSEPQLGATLAVNWFFTGLIQHIRTHPDTRLLRWWSRQRTSATFEPYGIRPDGHGVWQAHGRVVGFFLHVDAGDDDRQLLRQLAAHRNLAAMGIRYLVLLWTRDVARRDQVRGMLAGMWNGEVAVAAADTNSAGRVWYRPGKRRPYALHDLSSGHGSEIAANAGPHPHHDLAYWPPA
ncbi:replication-relaxation family protein [Longispora urticae]